MHDVIRVQRRMHRYGSRTSEPSGFEQAERAEMRFVAGRELGPGVGVALPAEMLERVGRGDAAQLGADRQGAPTAEPFSKPPRNASPTPVGSTIR